jgi:hypothetical protein
MLRLGAVLLILWAAPGEAFAQIVRGHVRDAESGAALHGVFVMLVDSTGQMRGGVLTNEQGFFATRAPITGTFTLRAERIGHASANSAPVLLSPEEARTVDFKIKVSAIALAPVEVSTGNRCIARPRAGQRTAQLWEEVRKALTVARWVENQSQIEFSARTYVRELEVATMRVRKESVNHAVTRFLPYAAIDADSLAQHGFVRSDGRDFVFYGPDAEVLLSPAFLNGHCFHNVHNDGMIGLGFRPTADSRLPDIEGVLWLDGRTLELRHIEYGYRNLQQEFRVRETGGRTEFLRLKSGAWIVSKWHIRMPTMVASQHERGGQYRAVTLREKGGEVLSVRDHENAQTVTHDGIVKGMVYDSVAGRPLAEALVYLSGTQYQAKTDEAGRFQMTGVPAGKYTVGFAHPAQDSMPTLPDPRSVDVRQLQEAEVDLGTKSLRSQLAAKCRPYRQAMPHDSVAGVVYGYVRNDRSMAVPDVMVTVKYKRYKRSPPNRSKLPFAEQTARVGSATDAAGYYVICGVPLNDPIEVGVADKPATISKLRITGRPYRSIDITLKD